MIQKLTAVDIRSVWSKEPSFSQWLVDNLDILSENIGLALSLRETESKVGPFSADLFSEDQSGRRVIIENQIEQTDHTHLGQILTYLSNIEAKVALWISTSARPEHVTAINYLSEVVPEDTNFYLVRLQAYQIGDSDPAPLFTVEAGPSSEVVARGQIKKELAENERLRYELFEQLLKKSEKKTNLFQNVSLQYYQHWVGTGAGKRGLSWMYVVMKDKARVELFFQHPEEEINTQRYEIFLTDKEDIEAQFGEALDWDYNESRKQQYIRSWSTTGGITEEDKWEEIQNAMIAKMIKLESVLKPYISQLEE